MERLNKLIHVLEQGKVAFGTFIHNGSYEEIRAAADDDYDFLLIEMEHTGFDFTKLVHSLEAMHNRKRIVESGSLRPDVVPLVRIPTTGEEVSQWIIKQTLDTGVYGIAAPQLGTVAHARSLVAAMRYPRPFDPTQKELPGKRGQYRTGARYWGLPREDYIEASDLWPLNPNGNLFLLGLIETIEGAKNLPEILRSVPGIGGIWAGPGDLGVSMGFGGRRGMPEVQEGLKQILMGCQEAGVPCCITATDDEVETRITQGFRMIILTSNRATAAITRARKTADMAVRTH